MCSDKNERRWEEATPATGSTIRSLSKWSSASSNKSRSQCWRTSKEACYSSCPVWGITRTANLTDSLFLRPPPPIPIFLFFFILLFLSLLISCLLSCLSSLLFHPLRRLISWFQVATLFCCADRFLHFLLLFHLFSFRFSFLSLSLSFSSGFYSTQTDRQSSYLVLLLFNPSERASIKKRERRRRLESKQEHILKIQNKGIKIRIRTNR